MVRGPQSLWGAGCCSFKALPSLRMDSSRSSSMQRAMACGRASNRQSESCCEPLAAPILLPLPAPPGLTLPRRLLGAPRRLPACRWRLGG